MLSAEFFTNSSERYSGARLFVDLNIMVAVSLRIMSEIVGHPSFLIRPVAIRNNSGSSILQSLEGINLSFAATSPY